MREEFQKQYSQRNTLIEEQHSSTEDSPENWIMFRWQYLHIASSKHQSGVLTTGYVIVKV